jgi:hypothetical protein
MVTDKGDKITSRDEFQEAVIRILTNYGVQRNLYAISGQVYDTLVKKLQDDPEMDATDAAHPAWWRGHEHTVASLVQYVNETLDGVHGDGPRGMGIMPWQALRQRLYDIRTLLGIAERIIGSTKRSLNVDQWYKVRSDYAQRVQGIRAANAKGKDAERS